MRILHFSDIHLGHWPVGFDWLFDKRLIGALNYRLTRRGSQDFGTLDRLPDVVESLGIEAVVCTGDLGSIGSPKEFSVVSSSFGWLHERFGERFMFVPGNHDYYTHLSVSDLDEFCRRLNGFGLSSFPYERWFGDDHFILVNGSRPLGLFHSGGKLSSAQLMRLKAIIERPRREGERRIFVCHFPAYSPRGRGLGWPRRISCENQFREWCESGQIDIYLCGHLHKAYRYGKPGVFEQLCSGSLTMHGSAIVLDTGKETSSRIIKI